MPDPQGTQPASLAYRVGDLQRRVEQLEHEKLSQGLALLQASMRHQDHEIAYVRKTLGRLETALDALRDVQISDTAARAGSARSWQAVWTYVVGGIIAGMGIALPIITIVTR